MADCEKEAKLEQGHCGRSMLRSGSCLTTKESFSIAWLVIFIPTGDQVHPLSSQGLSVLLCPWTVDASHLSLYSNMRQLCSAHKPALPRNAAVSEIKELTVGERSETLKKRQTVQNWPLQPGQAQTAAQ